MSDQIKYKLNSMQLELSVLQELLKPTKKEILQMRRLKFRINSLFTQIELQEQVKK